VGAAIVDGYAAVDRFEGNRYVVTVGIEELDRVTTQVERRLLTWTSQERPVSAPPSPIPVVSFYVQDRLSALIHARVLRARAKAEADKGEVALTAAILPRGVDGTTALRAIVNLAGDVVAHLPNPVSVRYASAPLVRIDAEGDHYGMLAEAQQVSYALRPGERIERMTFMALLAACVGPTIPVEQRGPNVTAVQNAMKIAAQYDVMIQDHTVILTRVDEVDYDDPSDENEVPPGQSPFQQTCEACEGTGTDPGAGGYECTACDGTGIVDR
jgi:hypothetical protein